MVSLGTFATPEELEALRSLSRAQAEAARAGDLENLGRLLEARRALLEGLQGRSVRCEDLEGLAAGDAETRTLLEAWLRGVELALAEVGRGQQALRGYRAALAMPGGVDRRL